MCACVFARAVRALYVCLFNAVLCTVRSKNVPDEPTEASSRDRMRMRADNNVLIVYDNAVKLSA